MKATKIMITLSITKSKTTSDDLFKRATVIPREIVPNIKGYKKKIKVLIGREYMLGTFNRYMTKLSHLWKLLR